MNGNIGAVSDPNMNRCMSVHLSNVIQSANYHL